MKKSIVVNILAASLCLAMVSLPGCGDSGQVPDNTDVGPKKVVILIRKQNLKMMILMCSRKMN